jgi:hypothetical protein
MVMPWLILVEMPRPRIPSWLLPVLVLALATARLCAAEAEPGQCAQSTAPAGSFFYKKHYDPAPLPQYQQLRAQLPAPILDDHPLWVETYWKAWQLAFTNFNEPAPGSGFVSQFIDASFNQNIFLWDSSFMSMFANVAAPLVPGISSLDNFYARQHGDGEIAREIVRKSGDDYEYWVNEACQPLFSRLGWHDFSWSGLKNRLPVSYQGRAPPLPNPVLTLDALDNPVLAWAELESYRYTGDKQRLRQVWEPLRRYYRALQKYLQQGNGLYLTDWASMDNSQRNPFLQDGGTAIDTSAQMALFARQLGELAQILDMPEAQRYRDEADALARTINQRMWDPARHFYFDLTLRGERAPVKTIAAYWSLIAHVASAQQARELVAELRDPRTFGRPNAVPTLAADETQYDRHGGYWNGSVWAPTTTMVIRGLENYGYDALARELALNHVDLIARVYHSTGTIWENYAPEEAAPGKPAQADFVGWSGIGPILYLLEYGVGLKPDAAANELSWALATEGRVGCEHYRFNGHVLSLVAEPASGMLHLRRLTIDSDGSWRLTVHHRGHTKRYEVHKGRQQFTLW